MVVHSHGEQYMFVSVSLFNYFSVVVPARMRRIVSLSWCRSLVIKTRSAQLYGEQFFRWAFNRAHMAQGGILSPRFRAAHVGGRKDCVNIINTEHNFIKSLRGACCVYVVNIWLRMFIRDKSEALLTLCKFIFVRDLLLNISPHPAGNMSSFGKARSKKFWDFCGEKFGGRIIPVVDEA